MAQIKLAKKEWVTTQLAGKADAGTVTTDLAKKVDRSVKDDQNATNTIDNQKGQEGCVMQSRLADANGTIISFNTATENGADGILGQVYAKNTTGADAGKGMRLNFTKTGAYYGVGTSTPIDTDHELAVKKDVAGEATRATNKENAIEAKVQVLENSLDHKLSLFKFEKAPGTTQPVRLPYYFDKVMDANKATITAYTLQMNNTTQTTPETFTMEVGSATSTTAGLMSAADKSKLDGLTPGGGGDIELKSYDLVYDTTAEAYIADFDEATYNKMKEGKVALNLVFKASGMTLFTGTLSDYYYLVGNNSIRGNILINGGVTTADMNTFMNVTIGHDGVGYVISAKPVSQMDGKTIVKNTDGTYKTLIGGYMEEGLVPGEIIAYELVLNKLASNPKIWFVGRAESLMAVGDTITAKVLDQDTGNSWTITNATATTYNIEGEDHIGVQLEIPKAGLVEFYVLNWVIDGEETVVVYNNDSTIELHENAIITAHKMTQGQIPHPIDTQFIPVDGTSIVVQDDVLKAVPEVSAKEFEMLSEEVATKQGDLTEVDGYDETKAQTLEHDASGKLMWVDK